MNGNSFNIDEGWERRLDAAGDALEAAQASEQNAGRKADLSLVQIMLIDIANGRLVLFHASDLK